MVIDYKKSQNEYPESENRTPIAGYILLLAMFIASVFFGWRALDDLQNVPTRPELLSQCAAEFVEYTWEDWGREYQGNFREAYAPPPFEPAAPYRGGKPIPVKDSIKAMYEKQFMDVPQGFRNEIPDFKEVYEATPMPECPKGVRGRIAVFEMLEMNHELEVAVLHGSSEAEIKQIARKQGMLSMKEDAMIKALKRVIPFEEVGTL